MFKLFNPSEAAPVPTYMHPISVEMPGDNGKPKIQLFKAQFKRLTQSELESLTERLKDGALTDSAMIDEVMVGWDGVTDEKNVPVEFNEVNLAALLEIYPTRPTIVRSFFASIKGAKTGN